MLPEITPDDELWAQHHYADLQTKAFMLHVGQRDRGGAPYCDHLYFVAEHQSTYAGRVIALFHDSIEDGKTTAESLLTYGLPESIVARIVLISRNPDQDYDEYITEVILDRITRLVKKWDVRHNLQLHRLPDVDEKDLKRIRRYQRAHRLILEVEYGT